MFTNTLPGGRNMPYGSLGAQLLDALMIQRTLPGRVGYEDKRYDFAKSAPNWPGGGYPLPGRPGTGNPPGGGGGYPPPPGGGGGYPPPPGGGGGYQPPPPPGGGGSDGRLPRQPGGGPGGVGGVANGGGTGAGGGGGFIPVPGNPPYQQSPNGPQPPYVPGPNIIIPPPDNGGIWASLPAGTTPTQYALDHGVPVGLLGSFGQAHPEGATDPASFVDAFLHPLQHMTQAQYAKYVDSARQWGAEPLPFGDPGRGFGALLGGR